MAKLFFLILALSVLPSAHAGMKKCLINGKVVYVGSVTGCDEGEQKPIENGTISGIANDTSQLSQMQRIGDQVHRTKDAIENTKSSSVKQPKRRIYVPK